MKTQNTRLGFKKRQIVELQEGHLNQIIGGSSFIDWMKRKIDEGMSSIGQQETQN